jgi:hypothetical protein
MAEDARVTRPVIEDIFGDTNERTNRVEGVLGKK